MYVKYARHAMYVVLVLTNSHFYATLTHPKLVAWGHSPDSLDLNSGFALPVTSYPLRVTHPALSIKRKVPVVNRA